MAAPLKNLPILMGALRQEAVDGELVLEQNDGVRKLYLSRGELVHLKSDVAGEQFGNYLLRQGILDFPALNELLANDERYRLGEKVIQWGMMSLEERDCHLQSLQEQIMIHALEHPILNWTWSPGPIEGKLDQDLHFKLQHRHFIWNTFQESNYLMDLLTILEKETDWRWEGRRDLLDSLSDLPLTPGTAYALSFLGADPISFETFRSLSNLGEEEAGRFIASLWGLGALILTRGRLPSVLSAPGPAPAPAAEPPARPEPPPPPMNFSPPPIAFVPPPKLPPPPPPLLLPKAPPPPPAARIPLPPLDSPVQPDPAPEFIELESEPAPPLPLAPPPPLEGPARAKKLVRKAKQLVLQDRTVEAVRALEQAVQFEPDADAAFEAWLLLGQLRLANPAWSTRSIDALQNASRIRPKAAEPWAAMGEVYHRKGFHANAVACFRKALELDPSVPVPQDIDLEAHAPIPAAAPSSGGGLFSKFRSILGRSEKP